MITDIIHLGDKVDIRLLQQVAQGENTGVSAKVYKSQVNDISSDGSVEITMPFENGRLKLLPLGVRYEFVFYAATGMYHCVGQIKERYKKDNINVLLIEFHSHMEKYQRRQYYRYPCLINATFDHITEEDTKEKTTEEIFQTLRDEQFYEKQKCGIILNVSGGGARILTEEKIPVDSNLLIILKLCNELMDTQHSIIGRVLSCEEVEDKRHKGQFESRIQFVFRDNKVREEIIRYIFEEERKDMNGE